MCRLLMLENERRMQPKSKVTCHGSEATISRQIRRVHEDLRVHQSYQTAASSDDDALVVAVAAMSSPEQTGRPAGC